MVFRWHLRIDKIAIFWDVDFPETFSVTRGLTPKSLEFCDFCSVLPVKRSWQDTIELYAISGGHRRIFPPLTFLITFTPQTSCSTAAKCVLYFLGCPGYSTSLKSPEPLGQTHRATYPLSPDVCHSPCFVSHVSVQLSSVMLSKWTCHIAGMWVTSS